MDGMAQVKTESGGGEIRGGGEGGREGGREGEVSVRVVLCRDFEDGGDGLGVGPDHVSDLVGDLDVWRKEGKRRHGDARWQKSEIQNPLQFPFPGRVLEEINWYMPLPHTLPPLRDVRAG